MDEDWIVRLRSKLGIVVKKEDMQICTSRRKPKPFEPDLPLAASSTGTIAGSAERIEVYRQRAERGEQVFHPNDCKLLMAENLRCHPEGYLHA